MKLPHIAYNIKWSLALCFMVGLCMSMLIVFVIALII